MFQKVIGQKPESDISPVDPANKDANAGLPPAPKPAANQGQSQRPTASGPSGRNVLSTDVEIKGTIKFSNDLVVDGKIEGHISSDGSLTVGENARIKAEVKTRSVIIYGKVHGNIEVSDAVELKANAELVGDIKAASLSIEPGAVFVGRSTVGTPTQKPQPQSQPQSQSKAAEKPAGNNPSQKESANELPLTDKSASGNKAVSS